MLHETYEILRKRLHDLHPAIGIPQGKRLCREADRFAASVLMQPEMFALSPKAPASMWSPCKRCTSAPTPP